MSGRPIEQSYCILPGVFLAGEYPRDKAAGRAQQKVDALTAGGVGAFIDSTEAGELLPYEELLSPEVAYQRFPIRDVSLAATAKRVPPWTPLMPIFRRAESSTATAGEALDAQASS